MKLFPFVPMSILRSELVHARRALYVMNDRSGDSIQIVRWLLLHASTCHCPETLPNVPRGCVAIAGVDDAPIRPG